MNDICRGLLECTPTPGPTSHGLTPDEVAVIGTGYGTLLGVFVLVMLFAIMVLIPTLVVVAATRD